MAPEDRTRFIVEPVARAPRFGTGLGIMDTEWGRLIGRDYNRFNQLVNYDPRSRTLTGLPTFHQHPITAIGRLKRGWLPFEHTPLSSRDECIITGDEHGTIEVTDRAGQNLYRWNPPKPQEHEAQTGVQRPIQQIVEGPGEDEFTVLYRRGASESCVASFSLERNFRPVVTRLTHADGCCQSYAAISPDCRFRAVRNEQFDAGWVLHNCSIDLEKDGQILPHLRIEGSRRRWLDDYGNHSFCFTPDSQGLILVGGEDGTGVTRWSTQTGEKVWASQFVVGMSVSPFPITQMRCSANGEWMIIVDSSYVDRNRSHLTILNLKTGEIEVRIASKHNIGGADFTDNDQKVALVTAERVILLSLDHLIHQQKGVGGVDSYDHCLLLPGDVN